jgi:hypothetical protein
MTTEKLEEPILIPDHPERLMKTIGLCLALLLAEEGIPLGQHQYLWIRLTENRVISNSKYQGVSGDTLVILRGGRIIRVPLVEVVHLRVINGSSTLENVLIGCGSGLAVGALLGVTLPEKGSPEPGATTTLITLGVIGAVVGGVVNSLEKPGDVVDLSTMSVEEKREFVRAITKQGKDDGK